MDGKRLLKGYCHGTFSLHLKSVRYRQGDIRAAVKHYFKISFSIYICHQTVDLITEL